MTIQITDFTIFNDINERLKDVTEEMIEVAAARLTNLEPTENVLGIAAPATRALWALSQVLDSAADLEKAKAAQLIDPQLTKDHEIQAGLLKVIQELVKDCFWAQCRSDVGHWGNRIGIRKEWQLVTPKESIETSGFHAFVHKLLRIPEEE